MLRLGADREVLRIHLQRRLLVAGAHAARARHPRRLRAAEERDGEALRARAHGAACDGDDGLSMDSFLRLLLRFILVPLGYLAAVIVGACVLVLGSWQTGSMMLSHDPDIATAGVFGAFIAGPIMVVVLASSMWMPSSVGILISEAFAIRSWIFHALNGAVSGWIGWQMFSSIDQSGAPMNETTFIFGAGLAGGFAYWAVAGWNAGFWKPVFPRRALAPPANNPFNPPARTEA